MKNRSFDLIVYGATSFVGQILTRYLFEHIGVGGKVNWAIAGRSEKKLAVLKSSLGSSADSLSVIVADASDEVALTTMCQSARVIASTVGPYALYGEPLVKACAENGTDYCDLCGEAYWIKAMILNILRRQKPPARALSAAVGSTQSLQIWVFTFYNARVSSALVNILIILN